MLAFEIWKNGKKLAVAGLEHSGAVSFMLTWVGKGAGASSRAIEGAEIDGLDLRVPLGPFSTELLRDRHLMTSRLDSRFAGYQLDAGSTNTSFDYSNSNIEDCFLTAFEAYVRNDLNYKNDNLYYVAGNAPPWSGEYNTVVNLEDGFAKNPHMHLFVGMGYYDFACPFYPVEWTIAHLKVSDEVKKNNISLGYYESGHMVYIDQPAAAKYHADLVKFVQASLPK